MVLESIILFFLVGIVLVGVGVSLAQLLSPQIRKQIKIEAYECGIPVKGGSWMQFNVGYYMYALIYLISM